MICNGMKLSISFIILPNLGSIVMAQTETAVDYQREQAPLSDPSDSETAVEETEEALSLDDIFHVLQNERRRQVIRYLRGLDGPIRMRDVAEQVAAWENDTTVENLHSDQRQRVYIALYQSHLPKLANQGIIRYNQPRGVIEPSPLLDEIGAYLDVAASDTTTEEADEEEGLFDDVTTPYLAATIISFVFVSSALVGLLPGTLLAGPWLAAGVLAIYSLVPISSKLNSIDIQ